MPTRWMEYIDPAWLWWGLVAAYCLTILSIVGVVLSENRNPLKSLAWVCVLIMFPVGGLVLYIFFGRSLKNTRMISRRKKRRLMRNEVADPRQHDSEPRQLNPASRQAIRLAHTLTGSQLTTDNHVEIFTSGIEKFESLLADIARARSFIYLQYYIIDDDEIGRRLADALLAKSAEGVKVKVIYDDIGSLGLSRSAYVKRLRAAGVEIHPFSRVVFPPFATRINWRNHRKVGVIDGVVGYIGGMNIARRYMGDDKKWPYWRDTHLRITGDAVTTLQYSFAVDWNFMGRPLPLDRPERHIDPDPRGYRAAVQLVTSGPTSRWSNVELMMLRAISSARHRILLTTPYFLPTESLLRALQTAALSKVDVRIMIPEHADSRILTHASRSYISECLRAGIKFYLFRPGMLHSKVLLVDDEFSTVGSTNFDFRSFEHNFEANAMLYSRELNNALAAIFLTDIAECERIKPSLWRRRPWVQKAKESITRLLSPIL